MARPTWRWCSTIRRRRSATTSTSTTRRTGRPRRPTSRRSFRWCARRPARVRRAVPGTAGLRGRRRHRRLLLPRARRRRRGGDRLVRQGPDAARRSARLDARHHEEPQDRPRSGGREVRRRAGQGHSRPGPVRRLGRQCAGRARHRGQDRLGPDQRVRRPGDPALPRGRDQAGQAPPDPDRLRRPDPAVASTGETRLRHADAGDAGDAEGPRAGGQGAGRLPRGHGVPHPGAAGGGAGGHQAGSEGIRSRTGRVSPIDVNAYVCVARCRHAGRLDRPGAGGRRRRVRHRDRRPVLRQRRPVRRVAGGGAGRGLLHPGRALRSRGPVARRGRVAGTDPDRRGDRPPQAAAGRPGGSQGGAERQVRPCGPVALRDHGGPDRGHHADLLCAGGRSARPRHGRAVRQMARPPADQLQAGRGRRQGAEELQAHRRWTRRPATRPRTPTSPCGCTTCCGRGWRARAADRL